MNSQIAKLEQEQKERDLLSVQQWTYATCSMLHSRIMSPELMRETVETIIKTLREKKKI